MRGMRRPTGTFVNVLRLSRTAVHFITSSQAAKLAIFHCKDHLCDVCRKRLVTQVGRRIEEAQRRSDEGSRARVCCSVVEVMEMTSELKMLHSVNHELEGTLCEYPKIYTRASCPLQFLIQTHFHPHHLYRLANLPSAIFTSTSTFQVLYQSHHHHHYNHTTTIHHVQHLHRTSIRRAVIRREL
jgi:hypothetical protein